MKHIFTFLFTLAFALVVAQDNDPTKPCFECDSFKWKNGYDELVDVELLNLNFTAEDAEQINFDALFIEVMVKAKYRLKNRLSFVPKKLTLMKRDNGEYTFTVDMYGKNAYGAESKIKAYFSIDNSGKITMEF